MAQGGDRLRSAAHSAALPSPQSLHTKWPSHVHVCGRNSRQTSVNDHPSINTSQFHTTIRQQAHAGDLTRTHACTGAPACVAAPCRDSNHKSKVCPGRKMGRPSQMTPAVTRSDESTRSRCRQDHTPTHTHTPQPYPHRWTAPCDAHPTQDAFLTAPLAAWAAFSASYMASTCGGWTGDEELSASRCQALLLGPGQRDRAATGQATAVAAWSTDCPSTDHDAPASGSASAGWGA